MKKSVWDEFYKQNQAAEYPSQFAEYCLPMIDKKYLLLDMGCGNGRDSKFFKDNGVHVLGIDNSAEAIRSLNNKEIPSFLDDFTDLPRNFSDYLSLRVGSIYYRFSLHSVTEEGANDSLKWAYSQLIPDGLVFIEVRCIEDEMYGKGHWAGYNAFINGHYRRFYKGHDLRDSLKEIGFNVAIFNKGRFAPYKDENPIVLRCVARKDSCVNCNFSI